MHYQSITPLQCNNYKAKVMSFPEYLNRIINSQLKNKEIETVRSEITKLISTQRLLRQDKPTQPSPDPDKKQEMPKTTTNFFNIHSLYRNSESKIEPRKTFSEVHINRLKKRLTLQQQIKDNKQIAEPQEGNMKDWREEMIKHLKVVPKNQLLEPKEEMIRISQLQETKKDFYQEKRKLKGARLSSSSPAFKRIFLKERAKEPEGQIRASSQKNIILIRPQPISEEELEEKRSPKLKKMTIRQRRSPLKNEIVEEDEYSVQKLANFTALLPFLGTHKAKVENRQQKKPKMIQIQQAVPQKQKIEMRVYKRAKKVPEEVIEISGWQIQQQL